MGGLRENQHIFVITSSSILLSMRNFSDRSTVEIKTHFMFKNVFFFSKIVPFVR